MKEASVVTCNSEGYRECPMESDNSMLILPDYRSFLSLPAQLRVHMATGSLLLLLIRYGVDLAYKQQPLIRGRGVSYCKNLLSPRFEHSEGALS